VTVPFSINQALTIDASKWTPRPFANRVRGIDAIATGTDSRTLHPGRVGAGDLSSEPAPGGEAESCAAEYVAVSADARSAGRAAPATAGARRGAGPIWLSTVDRVAEAGRLASECEADLSPLWSRGTGGTDEAQKKLASRARVPLARPSRPNERWSMDFVSARLVDGRWFRTLTVLSLYTRIARARGGPIS
jgi:hypothetical protein